MKKIIYLVFSVCLGFGIFGIILVQISNRAFASPTVAPEIVSFSPSWNSFTNTVDTAVIIDYDQNIDPSSVTSNSIAIHAMQTGFVSGTVVVDGDQVQITNSKDYMPGELVYVVATTQTTNLSAENIISSTMWQFVSKPSVSSGVFTNTFTTKFDTAHNFVSLGDLDLDGDLDIFVATGGHSNPSRVFFNLGHGIYVDSGQQLGNGLNQAVLGDLDLDGDLDAILTSDLSTPKIWINDGKGCFSPGQSINLLGSVIELGDVSGDGYLDLVIYNSGATNIWLNDKNGGFVDTNQLIAVQPFGLARSELGDVDLDGDLDLVIASNFYTSTVWINDGVGQYVDSGQVISSTDRIALGDLDSDGDLDAYLAVLEYAGAGIPDMVWLNQGGKQGGTLGEYQNSGQSIGPDSSEDVTLVDVDGDSDLDAVVAVRCCGGTINNKLYLNDGDGIFTDSGQYLGGIGKSIDSGDVDNDGDIDFVIGKSYYDLNENFAVWLNDYDLANITSISNLTAAYQISGSLKVNYTATISAGDDVVYVWDFDDGSKGEGQFPTHRYQTDGSYDVVVTATNAKNSLSTTIKVDVISYLNYLPIILSSE